MCHKMLWPIFTKNISHIKYLMFLVEKNDRNGKTLLFLNSTILLLIIFPDTIAFLSTLSPLFCAIDTLGHSFNTISYHKF